MDCRSSLFVIVNIPLSNSLVYLLHKFHSLSSLPDGQKKTNLHHNRWFYCILAAVSLGMLELRQAWRINIPFNFGKFRIWAPQKTANTLCCCFPENLLISRPGKPLSFLYVMFTMFTQKWLRLLIKTFSFVNIRQISTGFSIYWRQSRGDMHVSPVNACVCIHIYI